MSENVVGKLKTNSTTTRALEKSFDLQLFQLNNDYYSMLGFRNACNKIQLSEDEINSFGYQHLLPVRVSELPKEVFENVIKITIIQAFSVFEPESCTNFLNNILNNQGEKEGRKADVIILPENWISNSSLSPANRNVDLENPFLKAISEVAKNHHIFIGNIFTP